MKRYSIVFSLAIVAAAPLAAQGNGRNVAGIPPGHMPPAGMCRIWIDGVPPGRQPRATDCNTAERNRPRNARVIYGSNTRNDDRLYDRNRDGRIDDRDRVYNGNGNNNGGGPWWDPNGGGSSSNRNDGVWRQEGRDGNGNLLHVRRRVDSNGNVTVERARRDSFGRYIVVDRQVLGRDGRNGSGVYRDQNGNVIHRDQNGNIIHRDRNGNIIRRDRDDDGRRNSRDPWIDRDRDGRDDDNDRRVDRNRDGRDDRLQKARQKAKKNKDKNK